MSPTPVAQGGCTCGKLRYSLSALPICTHICHCRYCQRETGSSYALNAAIETKHITITTPADDYEWTLIPSASGTGQWWLRCVTCRVGVISIYGGHREKPFWIVRGGTLDEPDILEPLAHIWTSSKQPWVQLGGDIPAFEESYDPVTFWKGEVRERFAAILGGVPEKW